MFVYAWVTQSLPQACSVVSDRSKSFEIGALLSEASRRGSRYIHDRIHIGNIIEASQTVSSFPLSTKATKHIFVAGGIGITALNATTRSLSAAGKLDTCELHLAVRSASDTPFKQHLNELSPNLNM